MNLIESANSLINNLMAATIIALVLIGGFAFYFIKIKKVGAKQEKIDYSTFQRTDSREFVKFDDIVSIGSPSDTSGMGMIDLGGNVFVAGINVVGYNYRSAAAEERKATMANSIGFFNVVENPIQLRQTVKSVDIEHNISVQTEIVKDLNRELLAMDAEYEDTREAAARAAEDTDSDTFDILEKSLKKMQKSIRSKQWLYNEALEVLNYMKALSGVTANTKKINHIMFSYVFNPNEYIEELDENEIRVKAITALSNKAEEYSSVLENCGCTCDALTARDLTELMRRHLHPVTADIVKIEDLLNSSYTALYVTSDSIYELEKERQGDEQFEAELAKMQADFEKQKEEAMEKARQVAVAYKDSKETVSAYDGSLTEFFA